MTLRELQLFSLEILKDVHNFCESNKIKYSLYAGTLLGAIRHNGFIPWDDDIDIIMPRPDYNRFCNEYKSNEFEIINYDKDRSFSLAYSRVCDKKRTIYKTLFPCNKSGMGVWIDVFPADGFPKDEKLIPSFYNKALAIELKKTALRIGLEKISFHTTPTSKTIYQKLRHNLNRIGKKTILFLHGWQNPYVKKQTELCNSYNYGVTPYWGSLTDMFKQIVYHPSSDFQICTLHTFEDSEFYVFNGYDAVLKRLYGDYMTPPPPDKRVPPLSEIYKFYWK